jgi:hypothetical protein
VGWWSDTRVTMSARRTDRIDRDEADRLLAGEPTGVSRAGLAALLSEAAGPPRPEELTGEAAAVALFRAVRAAAPSTTAAAAVPPSTVDTRGRRRWYAASPARTAALRLGLVVVLLAAAGTLTVTLAYRPVRMQPPGNVSSSTAAPAPTPNPSSPANGEGRGGRPSPPPPGGVPGGTGAPAASGNGDDATAIRLCRVWTDARNDKAARDHAAEQLPPLMAALGGPDGVSAFCRKLLGPGLDGTTATSTEMKTKRAKSGG